MLKKTSCYKLQETILRVDVFGETFSFKLPDGNDAYRTWIGLFMTLLLYMVLLTYAGLKWDKVYNFGDSNVLEYYEPGFFDHEYIFDSDNDFHIAFGISDFKNDREPNDDPDYGEISANFLSWGLVGTVGATWGDPLPLKRCSSADLGLEEGVKSKYFFPTHDNAYTHLEFYQKRFWCIDFDKMKEEAEFADIRHIPKSGKIEI